jgi:hypothetical protein
MSVLANATFPLSGLSRSSGSGSIELWEKSVESKGCTCLNVPDESVNFLNCMLYFIESICRFDTQLENEAIDFIHDERDL